MILFLVLSIYLQISLFHFFLQLRNIWWCILITWFFRRYLPPFILGFWVGLSLYRPCCASWRLWVHISISSVVSKDTISLQLPITTTSSSYHLPASSSTSIPELWGEGSSHFWLSVSKPLILYTLSSLWVSMLIIIYFKKNTLLWWGLSHMLICKWRIFLCIQWTSRSIPFPSYCD